MSRLRIRGYTGKEFTMNVLQFRSPMSSAINSVQTHTMLQHFPIRCGQPDIQFTCKFTHRVDKTKFQAFVREHQVESLKGPDREITLWWPERHISNWKGYISQFQVAERRFDYSPVVTFGVDLIESMMSVKTTIGSISSAWTAIWGPQTPFLDSILKLPSQLVGPGANGVPTPPSAIGGTGSLVGPGVG